MALPQLEHGILQQDLASAVHEHEVVHPHERVRRGLAVLLASRSRGHRSILDALEDLLEEAGQGPAGEELGDVALLRQWPQLHIQRRLRRGQAARLQAAREDHRLDIPPQRARDGSLAQELPGPLPDHVLARHGCRRHRVRLDGGRRRGGRLAGVLGAEAQGLRGLQLRHVPVLASLQLRQAVVGGGNARGLAGGLQALQHPKERWHDLSLCLLLRLHALLPQQRGIPPHARVLIGPGDVDGAQHQVPLRERQHLHGREVLTELHCLLHLLGQSEEELHRQVSRVLLFVEEGLLKVREHEPGKGGAELVEQHLRRLASVVHNDLAFLAERIQDDRQAPLEVRQEGGAAQVGQELKDRQGAGLPLRRPLLRDARHEDVVEARLELVLTLEQDLAEAVRRSPPLHL
mmetsp:Transcript_91956/g.268917  ORF Transcript_91956/g.268917 Transcript_91956/m.268917 type:complete len:404 (+) Transcript_91956:1745-2956(+)